MNTDTNTANAKTRPLLTAAGITLIAGATVLGLTACGGSAGNTASATGAPAADGKGDGKLSKLLWMGDSIAAAQAPAVGAALKAAGVEVRSLASAGGGGVIGEVAEGTWKELPATVDSFRPDVIAYQITTYDWGTPEEQRAGYERLVKTAKDANAKLVVIPAPPFELDDFYKRREAAIESAPKVAEEVADAHPGDVRFLDSAALWGTERAGAKAQRSKDGIHSCQQGSAAFANWLAGRLGSGFSFTPAPADKWATGPWTSDEVFAKNECG